MDAPQLYWLLECKFRAPNGTADTISAFQYYAQKRMLIPTSTASSHVNGEWAYSVSATIADTAESIAGSGTAFTKKDAKKIAHAMILSSYANKLENIKKALSSDDSFVDSDTSSVKSSNSFISAASTAASIDTTASWYNTPVGVLSEHHTTGQARVVRDAAAEFAKMGRFIDTISFGCKSGPPLFMALDIEKDRKSSRILEVGIDLIYPGIAPDFTLYGAANGVKNRQQLQYSVLPESADKQDESFAYGATNFQSEVWMLHQLGEFLAELSNSNTRVLVGHSIHNDIKWISERTEELRSEALAVLDAGKGGDTAALLMATMLNASFSDIIFIDIAKVDMAIRSSHCARKLKTVGESYGIQFRGAEHVAGNDAACTMDIFLAMCSTHFSLDLSN